MKLFVELQESFNDSFTGLICEEWIRGESTELRIFPERGNAQDPLAVFYMEDNYVKLKVNAEKGLPTSSFIAEQQSWTHLLACVDDSCPGDH